LGLLEAIEGIGSELILGLVGMDEEGFGAVDFLDVVVWDTGLEVEDSVSVEAKDAADACGC
jgi:hypothetical protein